MARYQLCIIIYIYIYIYYIYIYIYIMTFIIYNDIELFGNRIAPVHTVRDLGIMLDSNMTMSQHVLRVCQNCYFQIRLIR